MIFSVLSSFCRLDKGLWHSK